MNPKYHLLVAAAALSLNACTTDDTVTETVPENGGYKISFTIAEDSETRTTLGTDDKGKDILRWVSTDSVGIYTANGGGNDMNINAFATADINNGPVKFVGSLENPVLSGDKFYAYYPYNKRQSTDPSEVTLTIPAEQTQRAAGVYDGQSQPLVAVPMEFKWGQNNYTYHINDVKFRLLGAIVELQLFSSDKMFCDEKIESVTFESDGALAGKFTFDLTGVTETEEPQISRDELMDMKARTTLAESAAIPAEDGKAALVYLTIAPGTYTGQIVVETDVALYTFSLAAPMNFKRAVIKGLPADLAEAKRDIIDLDAPIDFADPEVERICIENWDTNVEGEEGKGELSYREAAAVTDLGRQFRDNRTITSFNELRYFTGLQSIGEDAFYRCDKLTSVKIPDEVTTIGPLAFYDCRNLTSIKIPDEVTTIGRYAFYSCVNLTSINIPDKVTTIGESAFQFCNYLPSIKIPEGVTTIGQLAFGHCTSLKSITIPETVTSIAGGAFAGCPSLSAFYGKYSTDNNRCLIQDGTLLAFAQAGLTTYTIPEEVTKIGEYAFAYCYDLTSIHIPDGVTVIGNVAFNSCIRLTEIGIPKDVTEIGFSAFGNCYTLTSIHIPEGVTAIESSTFYRCSNLTEINIPTKVTTIRENAFRDCSSLKSVYCKPTTPPFLVSNAFNDTPSLVKIYVPTASVEKYKTAEGWISYADKIEADNNQSGPNGNDPIQFKDQNVKTICVTNWDTNRDGDLSYNEAAAVMSIVSKSEFQMEPILSFNELRYFTGLKTIEESAFWGCPNLTSITIPNGVTKIEESAFGNCGSLKSITIPNGVTKIGIGAFRNCSSLTSITIPDGVTSIGDMAFSGCSNLTSITIPDGVTEIEDMTFMDCSSLTSINIPQTVSSIGRDAFTGCSSLAAFEGEANNRCLIRNNVLLAFAPANITEYTIPNGVTEISDFAFENCSSLKSITIPDGVMKIGYSAFRGCSRLESVHCKPTTPPSLVNNTFSDTSSSMQIYVPTASVNAYKTTGGWIDYADQIVADISSTGE